MILHSNDEILKYAERTVRRAESRDPDRIASALGVTVRDVPFKRQKGVYKLIERNAYIFIRSELEPVMRQIVLLHELGHHCLHRKVATQFQEFNLFDMTNHRTEFEANLFAAHILLPDDEMIEYVRQGYDAEQIASLTGSDINLVALKVSDLARRGHAFRPPDHDTRFLK